MKTTSILAGVVLALAAGAASANSFRNVDSLVMDGVDGGGQIIVALDLTCHNSGGNFVMQTNRYQREVYRGCAYREGNRMVIRWNDGQSLSYSFGLFYRGTSSIDA